VEKAKLKFTTYPVGVTFRTPAKEELKVKFAQAVRYIDHEGKEMAGMEAGKFFNSEDTYAVKLRLEAGEEVPILYEARLTPEKGELPAFLKYPLGRIGAKRIRNAVVKTVTLEVQGRKLTRPALAAAGEDPIPFLTNQTETRTYDMKGEPAPIGQVLQPGMRVDAVVIPRAKIHLVLEARALVPIVKSEPPPQPKKIVEHKNVEVVKLRGNNQQTFLKLGRRNVQVKLDANLQVKDREGKDASAENVLQNGNRVDVKAEDLRPRLPHLVLLEVRLVSAVANTTTYQAAKVTKKINNSLYAIEHDGKTLRLSWNRQTKAFDAEGKPAALDAVLQEGKSVDLVVEAGRKTPFPRMLEVRPSKGK
jgi:hypothetical protein